MCIVNFLLTPHYLLMTHNDTKLFTREDSTLQYLILKTIKIWFETKYLKWHLTSLKLYIVNLILILFLIEMLIVQPIIGNDSYWLALILSDGYEITAQDFFQVHTFLPNHMLHTHIWQYVVVLPEGSYIKHTLQNYRV